MHFMSPSPNDGALIVFSTRIFPEFAYLLFRTNYLFIITFSTRCHNAICGLKTSHKYNRIEFYYEHFLPFFLHLPHSLPDSLIGTLLTFDLRIGSCQKIFPPLSWQRYNKLIGLVKISFAVNLLKGLKVNLQNYRTIIKRIYNFKLIYINIRLRPRPLHVINNNF